MSYGGVIGGVGSARDVSNAGFNPIEDFT